MDDQLQAAIAEMLTRANDVLPLAAQELVQRQLLQSSVIAVCGLVLLAIGIGIALYYHDSDGLFALCIVGGVGVVTTLVATVGYYSALWYPRAFVLDYARRFVN